MSIFGKKPSKELEYQILTEEFDPETGDDLPEKDDINKNLFEGNENAATAVKTIYKNAKYLRFKKYCGSNFFTVLTVIIITIMQAVIIYGIAFLAKGKDAWAMYLSFSIGLIFSIVFESVWVGSQLANTYECFYFKTGGKSVTFYLPKSGLKRQMIAVFNKKSIFQFDGTKFVDITQTTKKSFMGNRLFFSQMNGNVGMEIKRNKIYYYSSNSMSRCSLTVKNGQPTEMTYCERGPGTFSETMEIYNYNDGNDVITVPKAFLDLCEQKGIKAPINEHIKYI